MAFNYVLISGRPYEKRYDIVGLYVTKQDLVKAVNAELTKLFESKGKEQADSYLLADNVYFDGNTRFSIVHQDNDAAKFDPLAWDECTIQGMNGLDYIKTTKANRDKEIAEKEKGINDQNAQARNALKAHKLPKSYYDDTYCWCVISLEEYRNVLQEDADEIENAGDYAFYADTLTREDQLDALDSVNELQGELAILVGKTKFIDHKHSFGVLGKEGQSAVYPFTDDNIVYPVTDKGIEALLNECEALGLKYLAEWCKEVQNNGKLPKQDADSAEKAMVKEAMFSMRMIKDKDNDFKLSIWKAIHDLRNFQINKDMFLNYFK